MSISSHACICGFLPEVLEPSDLPSFVHSKCQGHGALLLADVTANSVKVNKLQVNYEQGEYSRDVVIQGLHIITTQ